MGVVGAFPFAAINRRLTWALTWQGMESSTMKLTAMVADDPDRRPHLQLTVFSRVSGGGPTGSSTC